MRRTYVWLALVAMLALVLAGCGGSDDGAAAESPAATTPAAESPAGEWTTIATYSSTDPKNELDLHISDAFAVSGDVQLVLDMPGGGDTDGVIASLLPADEPITYETAKEAESATLGAAFPPEVVSVPEGDYVLYVLPIGDKAWTVEVQTQQ